MFVLFLNNFQNRSICFYVGIISIVCAFSFMLGNWSGPDVTSVYSFEPDKCSLKLRNGSFDAYSPMQFPDRNNTGYLDCNDGLKIGNNSNLSVDYVAFSFPFSLNVDTRVRRSTKWVQALKAFLVFDEALEGSLDDSRFKFEAELMYFDGAHSENKWQILSSSKETRKIYCPSNRMFKGFMYGCTTLPIFQLVFLEHEQYRLEIRFFGECSGKITYISEMNRLKNVRLVLRHENVQFSQSKAYLKAFFCPLTLFAHLWFYETHRPFRSVIERILYVHSAALAALNIPFEYFLMWMQCPIWKFFIEITDMFFQSTLFTVWIVFYRFIVNNGQSPTAFSSYRPYLFILLWLYSLRMLDAFERAAVLTDPFYTPWRNSITVLREFVEYDYLRAVATLLAGFFAVYQLFRIYSKMCLKKNAILDLKAEKCLGFYRNSAFILFSVCIFSCVAMAILQFTLDQLLETHWKYTMFECVVKHCFVNYLYAPGVFTLYFGIANVFSIALLLLMPNNYKLEMINKRSDTKLPFYNEKGLEYDVESLRCFLDHQLKKPQYTTKMIKVYEELLEVLDLWGALEEDSSNERKMFCRANI